MYFVTTKSPSLTVDGKLPLTAEEALMFLGSARSSGVVVEMRDENGAVVSVERLEKEAGR